MIFLAHCDRLCFFLERCAYPQGNSAFAASPRERGIRFPRVARQLIHQMMVRSRSSDDQRALEFNQGTRLALMLPHALAAILRAT